MDFGTIIDKIIDDAESGSKEPFIIYRDTDGRWNYDYTHNQYGEAFGWVKSVKENNPMALTFVGKQFLNKSYPFVYNEVLCEWLREEYHVHRSSGKDTEQLYSMACFVTDNISLFSPETAQYLTTLDRPLAALVGMCPFDMSEKRKTSAYNESLIYEAADCIEHAIHNRLNIGKKKGAKETDDEKWNINSHTYKEISEIGNETVILSVNLKSDARQPYLVYSIFNERTHDVLEFSDYIPAMREYHGRQSRLYGELEAERGRLLNLYGVDSTTLDSSHCLAESDRNDYTGKLIIVKSEELRHEYRYADTQLIICSHGNGARPDAIGTSVFGKELLSGESVCYGRHQIQGIADESKLPQWAKDKLALHREQKERIQTARDAGKHKPSIMDSLAKSKEVVAATDNAGRSDKPKLNKHTERK